MLMLYVHFIPSLWICKVSFAKIYKFGVSGDHWQLGKASGLPHSDDLSSLPNNRTTGEVKQGVSLIRGS